MQEIQLCKPAESGCYLIAIRKSFIGLRRTLQAMPREAKIVLLDTEAIMAQRLESESRC